MPAKSIAKPAAPRKPQPKPFPQSGAAREAGMDQALAFLQRERKGKPTHNHDICRALGISLDAQGAGRLYAAMKSDARFIFRPDNLPAAFKSAKGARRKAS